ncbi:cyclic nucleotide-binding domain-containing protein 1-like [Rhopilema esculentum]|uniref:cyclic nucleotide-binding domain-containing protein 1-like n=1 Tax=Rhopilema esculentum TaxID=499914 RepID=UPI0031D12A4F
MDTKQAQCNSLAKLDESDRKVGFMLKKLPPIKNERKINYENLILFDQQIRDREKLSREAAHKTFMENYHMIFDEKPDITKAPKESLAEKPKRSPKELDKVESHNITEHLAKLHRHRASPTKEARSEELMRKIRKLCRKPPFDRTSKDNQLLFKCLANVNCFSHISRKVLQKLVTTAYLEKWEANFTVFGDSGLYLIIKGACAPYPAAETPKVPAIQREDSEILFDDVTMESPSSKRMYTLTVGDHFGRLEHTDDSEEFASGILSVTTLENCELLRFASTSYERVAKQVKDAEYNDKVQLAQSCTLFKDWPNLSLKRISEILRWAEVPAGETLALEGNVSSTIYFIKSGVCQLKKTLSVAFTTPDGRKVKRRKEVVTGTLEAGDSFGEKSLMLNQPIEQSVVSETALLVATIELEDVQGLDEVTRALFLQTCEASGTATAEASIKKKYVEKQVELEWKSKKEAILNDVLYHNGIVPGYSKWSRNPHKDDVTH